EPSHKSLKPDCILNIYS
ncbi:hypothetical protein CWATWH0003_1177b4, partial [Crocosphaera watsonii WH 0003]